MKLIQLVKSMQGLNEIAKTNLGAKRNFQVAMFIRALLDSVTEYNKQHDSLALEYGEDLGEGRYGILPQNKKAYDREIISLENQEIDFNIKEKIKVFEQDYMTGETVLNCFEFLEFEEKSEKSSSD